MFFWGQSSALAVRASHTLSRFREGVELDLHEARFSLSVIFLLLEVTCILLLAARVFRQQRKLYISCLYFLFLFQTNAVLLFYRSGFCVGLIYIVNRLDYEARSKYELLVRATDSVSGAHSEVPISVSVEDANDSPPEFGYNEYNVTLSEATPPGTLVLAVSAHDLDSGRFSFIREKRGKNIVGFSVPAYHSHLHI